MLEPVIDKVELPTPPDDPRSSAPVESRAAGTLARRFVELLLDDTGRAKAVATGRTAATKTIFDEFGLADDPEDDEVPNRTLPIDEVAVAVLLAAQMEDDPSILRAMRKEAPVVVLQAPDARTTKATDYVVRVCCFGRTTSILSTGTLADLSDSDLASSDRRQGVILSCDVDKRGRQELEQRALSALSLAVPVCAISVDIGRAVPEQVRVVADRTIVPGGWNVPLLAVLIEAVTGTAVAVPDESWISSTTLDDLRMSISRHRGAAGSLERLRSTVQRRVSRGEELPDVRDLHGYGAAKAIVEAMLADLKDYRDGKVAWSAMSRGLVLAGPTGTGKTFLARCFARSAGLPLVIGSMAQWQSAGDGHLGDCLSAMKRTFSEARASAPSILFIDELDSIGDRATFHYRHLNYSSQVVNSMLEELDGANDRSGVTVLAATNHVDRIDPAILRPGRLDRVVTIGMPDAPELAGILRTLIGADLPGVDLMPVALAGRGGSGAAAASWVRQARGIARRAGRDLEIADLLCAVREGREILPETERRRIAIHEAAHAAAAVALDIGVVGGVSIHDAGGTTLVKPAARTTTRHEAVAVLVHLLAGRAAERHFLGSVSAGAGGQASSDLALATKTAIAVEGSWGLGENGAVWFGDVGSADFPSLALVPGLLGSVRRLLRHCEAEAGRFVAANEQPIRRCAGRLQTAGHLDANEVLAALGPIDTFVPAIDVAVPPDGTSVT
ncbi:AAA family ATPase [Aurantimonas sp. MSK8Z-1]|uniref:AAA family ATPase n=1 Tax=Mangrovibrevibacter kandeliae TaxID=2968473 RepID=UPI00211883D5|nr:AAA family ATPase [Aurantimonas sp. MSK8Z-1]MCW4114333.1 AAA family ATPase [Aurantimonas sp. MSK8Z-1]